MSPGVRARLRSHHRAGEPAQSTNFFIATTFRMNAKIFFPPRRRPTAEYAPRALHTSPFSRGDIFIACFHSGQSRLAIYPLAIHDRYSRSPVLFGGVIQGSFAWRFCTYSFSGKFYRKIPNFIAEERGKGSISNQLQR